MVKDRMRETLTIRNIVVGERDIAMELETELLALEDWPDFFSGPVKTGELRRSHNFIWYQTDGRKFRHIRSARYRQLEGPSVRPLRHDIPPQDTAGTCISRESLQAYMDAFNRGDSAAYGKYYTDDVVLVIAGERELRGRQAILDFYKDVKSQTQRTIQINKVVSTPSRIAAELQSEFLALADVPDMVGGPLRKGARRFINTFVFYDLRDGKFARLRSATFQRIDRPPA
jgi:hypothetical protein